MRSAAVLEDAAVTVHISLLRGGSRDTHGGRRFPSASRHYAWTNKERSSDRIGTSVHVQRRRSMHEGGTARSTRSSGRFRRTEARPRAPARIFAQALDPGLALWGRPPSSSPVLTTAGGDDTGFPLSRSSTSRPVTAPTSKSAVSEMTISSSIVMDFWTKSGKRRVRSLSQMKVFPHKPSRGIGEEKPVERLSE